MQTPLPTRNGINATRLKLPDAGPWPTIFDYVMDRFGHVDPQSIRDRFARGEVQGIGGVPIKENTPLGEHQFLWYYRQVPQETPVPFDVTVLERTEHLIVADKPHFLPTTPGGKFLAESALVRLRRQLDLPELAPIHRLDRMTAGVVLFATNPKTRGAYQSLFERRQIHKVYEALAPIRPELVFPRCVRSRLYKSRDYLLTQELSGEPNAETWIEAPQAILNHPEYGRYQLKPRTGKTHQLRVHMASLGIGIINDRFYPELLEDAPDDYHKPLQLIARSLEFVDPLNHKPVNYHSQQKLQEL